MQKNNHVQYLGERIRKIESVLIFAYLFQKDFWLFQQKKRYNHLWIYSLRIIQKVLLIQHIPYKITLKLKLNTKAWLVSCKSYTEQQKLQWQQEGLNCKLLHAKAVSCYLTHWATKKASLISCHWPLFLPPKNFHGV